MTHLFSETGFTVRTRHDRRFAREHREKAMAFTEEAKRKAADTRAKKAEAALKRTAAGKERTKKEALARVAKNDVLYKEGATAEELYAAIKESSRLLRALAK